MGDYIKEDGTLYAATPIDPVFILLPIFDKNGNDPGKFRQLDEIIYIQNYPDYHHLSSIAEKSMEVVCDCKDIGSTKFFRLIDSKILSLMYSKVQQLKQTLLKMDKNYAVQSQKDTLVDAVMILGTFISFERRKERLSCYNFYLPVSGDIVFDKKLLFDKSKMVFCI